MSSLTVFPQLAIIRSMERKGMHMSKHKLLYIASGLLSVVSIVLVFMTGDYPYNLTNLILWGVWLVTAGYFLSHNKGIQKLVGMIDTSGVGK